MEHAVGQVRGSNKRLFVPLGKEICTRAEDFFKILFIYFESNSERERE